MSRFRFPHDAFALTAALSDGLSEHIHDDLSDRPTFDVSRFRVLMTDRDVALEDAIKSGAAATVVVAASNSTSNGQTGADVVCSGSGDQVAINNAIGLANGAHNGGRVLLLEGTYNISGPITMLSNVDFCGVGWGSIINNTVTAGAISMISAVAGLTFVTIHDLMLQGNKASWVSGVQRGIEYGDNTNGGISYSSIYGVLVQSTHDEGMYLRGANHIVRDCQFTTVGGTAIVLDGGGVNFTNQVRVINNTIFQPGKYGCLFTGNCTTCTFTLNMVRESQQHGILLDNCGSCQADYNVVLGSGQQTTNTYDGIHANANAATCEVCNNKVQFTAGNQARYGIATDLGSSGLCTMNRLSYGGGSGASGTLLNNGTWTTTAGNV